MLKFMRGGERGEGLYIMMGRGNKRKEGGVVIKMKKCEWKKRMTNCGMLMGKG